MGPCGAVFIMSASSHSAPPTRQRLSFGSAEIRDHLLDVRLTGSGSEYVRIWIVNLLLMLVTLSLYYPWAKVRRLRYFHGCTELDSHPLEFHGNPWAMLRGYVLVGLLTLVGAVVFATNGPLTEWLRPSRRYTGISAWALLAACTKPAPPAQAVPAGAAVLEVGHRRRVAGHAVSWRVREWTRRN